MSKNKNIVLAALAALITPAALLGGPYESEADAFVSDFEATSTYEERQSLASNNDALRTDIRTAYANGASLTDNEQFAWMKIYGLNIVHDGAGEWKSSLGSGQESNLETMDNLNSWVGDVAYSWLLYYFRTPSDWVNADGSRLGTGAGMKALLNMDWPDATTKTNAYGNVVSAHKGTARTDFRWIKIFKEYRAMLGTLQSKIDLTKTEIDGLRSVSDRSNKQDAWMDTLMRDLVSYQMEQ